MHQVKQRPIGARSFVSPRASSNGRGVPGLFTTPPGPVRPANRSPLAEPQTSPSFPGAVTAPSIRKNEPL